MKIKKTFSPHSPDPIKSGRLTPGHLTICSFLSIFSLLKSTRQLSYRKEDRAMPPIYECPEKVVESSLRTWLLLQKFVMDFCSDRY